MSPDEWIAWRLEVIQRQAAQGLGATMEDRDLLLAAYQKMRDDMDAWRRRAEENRAERDERDRWRRVADKRKRHIELMLERLRHAAGRIHKLEKLAPLRFK